MKPDYEFKFTANTKLPRLAWVLHLKAGSKLVEVTHGQWLETDDRGFCEGAWSGDFLEWRFHERFMTGTGARTCSEGLLLVTPNHTLDRLNVLQREGELYASNSLSFLLAMTGEALDTTFPYYDSCIASIKYGLNRYERAITTESGALVGLYYACNLLVTQDLALHIVAKSLSPRFVNFAEYRSYLGDTVTGVARNARDPCRSPQYAALGTVSRGYDSPAALVIAKEADCNEAFTFRGSRGTRTDEDSGTVIAKHLGMSVREFDRLEYCEHTNFPEILNSGGPNEFLSFGENLEGRLLFTGFHGDKVWDKNCEEVSEDFVRSDASGSSLTEFRLEAGFVHLPVPFIGADNHPCVHAISNSNEMKPWSLGNYYDRPIARRIVEDFGVPRELFGQKKHAAGIVVPKETLARTMSRASYIDFQDFVDAHWSASQFFNMEILKLVRRLVYFNERAIELTTRARRRLGVKNIRLPFLVPHKLNMLSYGYLGKEAFLFHWGVDKLISRYSAALED